MFLKHFASKNQLPGLSLNGTLVENGLRTIEAEAYHFHMKILVGKFRSVIKVVHFLVLINAIQAL